MTKNNLYIPLRKRLVILIQKSPIRLLYFFHIIHFFIGGNQPGGSNSGSQGK